MPIVPRGYVHQSEVEGAIFRAQVRLQQEVVRIRYTLGSDWSGEPSIFFRIVVSDAASHPSNLKSLAQRVALGLMDEVQTDEFGLHAYFNFRSESEQAALRDPAWA